MNGFTNFGDGAPNLKIITGNTDNGQSADIAHGLIKSKILSVLILICNTADQNDGANYPDHINTESNTEYRYFVNTSNIVLADVWIKITR